MTAPGSRGQSSTGAAGRVVWPEGKRFAFTVFDDTDATTPENGPPVYDFLADLGFRTTKSVWPVAGGGAYRIGGTTCDDAAYRTWVQTLHARGFEIALHNVTYHTSRREETKAGFERFRELFGSYPRALANHAECHEAIYWGDARLSGPNRLAYNLLTRFGNRDWHGHRPESRLFWGDLCLEHVDYVRNFVYRDVNTLKVCPWMPYSDPDRPYVRHWFASSEGAEVEGFKRLLDEAAQERLEEEGGACIVYTHFGAGFHRDGRLDGRFQELMRRLASRSGWFVPVSTLLDLLRARDPSRAIGRRERARLERRWLWERVRGGGTI